MRRLIIAAAMWLTACATLPNTPPAAVNDPFLLTLPPSSLQQNLQLNQQMTIAYNGQSHDLDALFETTPTQVQLALIKFGRRVLTLRYDGAHLEVNKDFLVPQEIKPEQILSDVQLVFWPYESIAQQLPKGYTLIDSAQTRTLSLNGEPLYQIRYSTQNPRWQRIELSHLKHHYTMIIVSQSTL
ncbi:MAG: DUF3261 domain-containing protein [Formosimonas sp.]